MASKKIEVQIVGDASSFQRALGNATSTTSKLGGVIGKLGLGAGAALVGIGIASVKSAAAYEQSLNVFQAVTKATGGQMKQVSKLSKDLGNDLTLPATSAKDAADAMTELAKGGLSVKDTMSAAKGVLQLSAAAQISNADAATITARALNSFGLEGSKAIKVADLLAATSNASTAEISDLALGMQASSAVFKSGRQTIDELTSALGLMANAGIVGSDAGTSLKTMMLALEAPSNKAAERMKELGINVRDAQGHMLPMRDLIQVFTEKTRNLSDAQRDAALKTIFGTDAIRAANVILEGGTKAWDKMHDATTKGGEAADLAASKTKGFSGALEGFKSAAETLQITLGTLLLPKLTTLVQNLSRGTQFVNSFVEAITHLDGVNAAVARSTVTAGNSVAHTGAQMDAGTKFVLEHRDALTKVEQVLKRLGEEYKSWGEAIGTAISKVSGAISSFKKQNDELDSKVKAALVDAANAIKNAFNSVLAFIEGLPGRFASAGAEIGRAIVSGIVSGLGGIASSVGSKIADGVGGAIGFVKGKLGIHSPSTVAADEIGKPIAEGVIMGWLVGSESLPSKLKDKISAAIEVGRRTIEAKRSVFQDAFSRMTDRIFSAFDAETASHLTPTGALLDRAAQAQQAIEQQWQQMDADKQFADAKKALADAQNLARNQGESDADFAKRRADAVTAANEDMVQATRTLEQLQYQIQVASLQKQADAEQQNYQSRRDNLKQSLEDRLTAIENSFTKEGGKVGDLTKDITNLLRKYGIDFAGAGEDLGAAFVAGLKASIAKAGKGSSQISKTIASVANGISSGASSGASGFRPDAFPGKAIPMASGGSGTVSRPTLFLAGESGREQYAFSGGGRSFRGGGTTIVVHMPNYLGNVQDAAAQIRRELLRTSARNGSVGLA